MAGQEPRLVRRRALGSEAIYQVIAEDKQLVELEVVSASGLEPGTHLKVTRQAVKAMERLDQPQAAPTPPLKLSQAPELP